jgi:hypothetical protein
VCLDAFRLSSSVKWLIFSFEAFFKGWLMLRGFFELYKRETTPSSLNEEGIEEEGMEYVGGGAVTWS